MKARTINGGHQAASSRRPDVTGSGAGSVPRAESRNLQAITMPTLNS